jgi:hypothetical protein
MQARVYAFHQPFFPPSDFLTVSPWTQPTSQATTFHKVGKPVYFLSDILTIDLFDRE